LRKSKAGLKSVYFFGKGRAEGGAGMKEILGGKGANLAEMTGLGIPVPPGFTISTVICAAYYDNRGDFPPGFEEEVLSSLTKLEKIMGKKLGDPADPLLVSVRSGAAVSMPGMMDTILNLGMNDQAVQGLAGKTGNSRFAWDAYRRFIQMYGDVVMQVPHELFEKAITDQKKKRDVVLDTDLSAADLEELVAVYKEIVRNEKGVDFPQDPLEQLWGSIRAVFGSWMNERAIRYRSLNNIRDLMGTAVNVQSMVFGNFGEDSGTGVCFSRDPSTGINEFYGEYLMNAQGEDVVAGIRTPEKLATLSQRNPEIYRRLVDIKDLLENHFRDMQDMEFTVQQGVLYILQTRSGKRSGTAAVRCAIDMVQEKLIDKNTAILRVSPAHLDQLLHPMIDPGALENAVSITRGLNASPGAAAGRIVFTAQDAESWHNRGEEVLLVRKNTSPEDIGGMAVSQGVLTSTGGMTSHAAVVARGMGIPCVAGATGVSVIDNTVVIGGRLFNEGDWITIDGSTGDIYAGKLSLSAPEISPEMNTFLGWCDEVRESSKRGKIRGFKVRTNADQPEDAKRAFAFGADGVGLCRTEHMFFDKEKLIHFRAMIVADTEEERKLQLGKILPLQRQDFFGIFKAMEGRPVTIRLLDPPLHEFVPHTREEVEELALNLGLSTEKLQPKIDRLRESNPMLGHRGCRLAITYPEIYDMQVEAIARAAADCIKQGIPVEPEIMIPIVITARELKLLRPNVEAVLQRVFEEEGLDVPPVHIGTMIEVPRAAIRSGHIAKYADFFSFGTNDLTQMTFAFSRDDAASFLPSYLEKQVLDVDPFKSIDEEGVGDLMRFAIGEGRAVKPELKIGICGEHGGDPQTIDFCYRSGLSYVSCSPFRVPLARLAGAQAVINNSLAAASEDDSAGKTGTGENKSKLRREKKSMSDEEKKTTARKPARKAAAAKTAAVKKPGRPAAKKAADAKTAAAKKPGRPAAKKAADAKTAAAKKPGRSAVKKAADAKTAAVKKPGRPAAKKTVAVKAAAAKKPGRPAAKKTVAVKAVAAKKPGRSAAKPEAEKKTPGRRGRPAVAKPEAEKKTPGRRGRPAVAKPEAEKKTPGRRGRPAIAKPEAEKKTPGRRGRPAGSKNLPKAPVVESQADIIPNDDDIWAGVNAGNQVSSPPADFGFPNEGEGEE
jgi:pyruvate,orthophosphate dikinase